MKTTINFMKKSLSASAMWAIMTILILSSAGTVNGQKDSIYMDDYSSGQNVPIDSAAYDSIAIFAPTGVIVNYWNPGGFIGNPFVKWSGFDGQITCSYIGGSKIIRLRPISMPIEPSFDDTTICGIANINLDAGNYSPYGFTTYLWAPGAQTTSTITVGAGTYSVTVTNACGSLSHSATITQYNPNPPDLGPDLTVCQGTVVTLNPGSGYSNVLWSGGATTPTYTPTVSGTYIVQTTNTVGACVDVDTVQVTFLAPPSQEIDLVTIDTSNGNNMVTWDGLLHGSAVTTNIYRELTSNNYQLVGTAVYTTGTWTDTIDSRNQPWRYKISLVDTCGNEGIQSAYVQSIHSWVTATIGGGYTVQWTAYEVENKTVVDQYNIYYGNQLSQLNFLTFVSGSVTVYTMASFVDSVYVIGAQLSAKGAESDALSNWVSQNDALGIAEGEGRIEFLIYPNPVSDVLNIRYEGEIVVEIFNIVGEKVLSTIEKTIPVSNLSAGVYTLKLTTANGGYGYKKIIKL